MKKGVSQEQLAAAFPDDVDPRLKYLSLILFYFVIDAYVMVALF